MTAIAELIEGEKVLGWLSDHDNGIDEWPAIIWNVDGHWWSGVPGKYLSLTALEWTVARWERLPALRARQAGGGDE